MMNSLNPADLRTQFIAWQCRIRQYSVRKNSGVPSAAMRPELEVAGQNIGAISVQIVKTDSVDITREFRFMAQKTQEHQARYEGAIKLLSEYYYQIPDEFDEEMTAVFSMTSELAKQIIAIKKCLLHFNQGNQIYRLRCQTRAINVDEQKHQSTYWHNALFNPSMPGLVRVIGFTPDWDSSRFETSG